MIFTGRIIGNQLEGIVELYHDYEWRTVCSHSFSSKEGDVFCRQIGFMSGKLATYILSRPYSAVWLDLVVCDGSESDLTNCKSTPWGVHTCYDTSLRACAMCKMDGKQSFYTQKASVLKHARVSRDLYVQTPPTNFHTSNEK